MKLLDNKALAAEIGLDVRTIRTLTQHRKIPVISLGYKTKRYDLAKVRAALERFEIKEIGARA